MNADAGAWELGDQIDEGIAAVFPLDLSGVAVALRACIDASTHSTGTFAVAGIAFGYDRAVKANAEWAALMNGRTFHMTDLHARQGEFAGISDDEVAKIMHGMVSILRRYASLMVAVACDASFVADYLPKVSGGNVTSKEMLGAFRSPYGAMCHLCMWGIGLKGGCDASAPPSVSYVLEQGDEGQRGFARYLDYVSQPETASALVPYYSLAQFTVATKGSMAPIFHAADFVAWEWAKQIERMRKRPDLKMRGSLAALTDGAIQYADDLGDTISDGKRILFRSFNAATVQRYGNAMTGIIAAATPSQVDAAVDLWNAARSSAEAIRSSRS